MYHVVQFLEKKLVTIVEVWVTTKDAQPLQKPILLSLSLLQKVKNTHLRFLTKPRVTSNLKMVNHDLA
jgi:hypothetical protein